MNLIDAGRVEAPSHSSVGIVFSLLATGGALEARLDRSLAVVDLSMPKLCLLTQIVENGGPLALSELAAGLRCVRSNVTQLVDRLEAEGLVRRVDDQKDRRIVRAELTELGAERQAVGQREVEKVEAELSARLSAEDQRVVLRVLRELQ